MATHSSILAWKSPWTGEPGEPSAKHLGSPARATQEGMR